MPDSKEKIEKPEAVTHTYAEDLAEEIKKEQGSAYRTALKEEARKEEDKKEFSPLSGQNLLFLLFSFCLLVLAIGLIFLTFRNKITPAPTATTNTPSVLLPGAIIEIPLGIPTKEKIFSAIKNELAETRDAGKISSLYFTEEKNILESGGDVVKIPLNIRRLMFILEIKAPELLLKSLGNEFMVGVYNNQLFLILKIEAFNNAFRGMREWEETVGGAFKDVLVKNQDARIQENEAGDIVLIYGFKGEKFIVIAKDRGVLFEIISRLQ